MKLFLKGKNKPTNFRNSRSRAEKKEEFDDKERSSSYQTRTTPIKGVAICVADGEEGGSFQGEIAVTSNAAARSQRNNRHCNRVIGREGV
jgi:hypothetical protein